MRLFLIRHGQTKWNVELRAQGHTDIPLDETGCQQAEQLASSLTKSYIRHIWTSDMQRALGTAQPIASITGAPLRKMTVLRERKLGVLEGKPFYELGATITNYSRQHGVPYYKVPIEGGESIEDVWNRLDEVIAELDDVVDNCAIVSHGGTTSLLLAKLVKGNIETARSFRLGNASVTVLERYEDRWLVHRVNDTSHLSKQTNLAGSVDGATR
ncbi:MAG: histidine phosphatase family protein [Armatimonadetes bacterium]|nr:histidine phosphatase family protein [Armatimonadota bacterium]